VDLCISCGFCVNPCIYCDEPLDYVVIILCVGCVMAVIVFLELVMEEVGDVLFCCLSQTGCVCHCWLVLVVC
jgi:hypothetical protein